VDAGKKKMAQSLKNTTGHREPGAGRREGREEKLYDGSLSLGVILRERGGEKSQRSGGELDDGGL